jgi:hypothetical protein
MRRNGKQICTSAALVLGGMVLMSAGEARALPGVESPDWGIPTESCFWGPAVTSDPEWNFVYADSNAVYQCSSFDFAAGSELIFQAEFPHSRHISWTIYGGDGMGTPGGQGSHQIIDTDIVPNPGSVNPFINGTNRQSKNRSYTIRAVPDNIPPDPADREPNTLYSSGPRPGPFGTFLCVRIYVPDAKDYPFGDTLLPEVTLVEPDGTVLTDDEAVCEAVDALNKGFGVVPQAIGFDLGDYVFLRQAGLSLGPNPAPTPPTHPALDPPDFKAFFNAEHQRCSFFTPQLDCGDPTFNPDGVGLGNPSNRYIETYIDKGFGDVLVLRAKKPTTPKTWQGNPFVEDLDYDLVYYSLCPQESLATWRVGDCIFDEELPTDSEGFYTLVLSRPTNRPDNANEKCGIAWASTPPAGDGAGDLWLSNIWIRFMLPSENFDEAAQNVLTPGTEEEVMGPYLPVGEYMSKEDFEARGCPKGK